MHKLGLMDSNGVDSRFDAYMFFVGCHKRLHKLGLVDSNGVDFTLFQFFGPARQW